MYTSADRHTSCARTHGLVATASFDDAKACTETYLAHIEELRTAGWDQLDAAEHAKTKRAHR